MDVSFSGILSFLEVKLTVFFYQGNIRFGPPENQIFKFGIFFSYKITVTHYSD